MPGTLSVPRSGHESIVEGVKRDFLRGVPRASLD